ncbi:hypothetical protein SAMN05421788_101833 [Filimonas lacunae]|uniref:DUF6046 domain-containing protein n=1 Tax=Filimonas lacunae TaxID=477680 RepID=A0A173MPK9_9BACT|nr:DUF6046 domain-containing protein [Filimonas lacunae]BAV09397.1 hypothetical protein FLA_5445 [Filimonas lacunae]SIS72406.1 hypothetical protein SAMN05421788_101833 [Filimonas lacunae]
MSSLIYDLEKLYKQTFGTKPEIVKRWTPDITNESQLWLNEMNQKPARDASGAELRLQYEGVEIWLPTKFWSLPSDMGDKGTLLLPYTVVKIKCKKTIVKTPLAERRGTIKEQYSTEDYAISLKGFVIDKKRVWPYNELTELKRLFELNRAVNMSNALTNIFIGDNDRVVIESFELPEVQGGRNHVRPFTMELESDTVFTLETSN